MTNYTDSPRKKVKRHKDKRCTTTLYENTMITGSTLSEHSSYAGQKSSEFVFIPRIGDSPKTQQISDLLVSVYKNKNLDSEQSRLVGLCYDNVSLCPVSQADVFSRKVRRMLNIAQTPSMDKDEIDEMCEWYLDLIEVKY